MSTNVKKDKPTSVTNVPCNNTKRSCSCPCKQGFVGDGLNCTSTKTKTKTMRFIRLGSTLNSHELHNKLKTIFTQSHPHERITLFFFTWYYLVITTLSARSAMKIMMTTVMMITMAMIISQNSSSSFFNHWKYSNQGANVTKIFFAGLLFAKQF